MQDLIQAYLRIYRARLKPSTFRDYQSILSRHLKQFGTLAELVQSLEDYLAAQPISGKRRNNIVSCARSFTGWAQRRGHWTGREMAIPRWPHRAKRIEPLTAEEARLVMAWTPAPAKWWFRMAILTGLRTGECLGLQFQDLDRRKGVVRIRRTISGGAIVVPKTESSEREIPASRAVREIWEIRERGNSRGSEWLWYGEKRGLISLSWLRRIWKTTLSGLGIDYRPLYATRHTFASLAIAAGEDPLWVAKMMGHSRPDQLLLRYATYQAKGDGERLMKLLTGEKSFIMKLA